MGLALVRTDVTGLELVEVSELPEDSRDSSRLLFQVDEFLKASGVGLAQLDGIAVCAGPGGFTRVRVACAVAQGIALGRQLPVAAIHSMQAQAAALWMMHHASGSGPNGPEPVMEVTVLLDARMDEIYAATYQITPAQEGVNPQLTALHQPGLLAASSVALYFDRLPATPPGLKRLVSGDGAGRYFRADHSARASAANWCGTSQVGVVQTGAGEMALAALALAGPSDWVAPGQVVPFYLREKIALTIDEQAALRAENRAVRP